LFESSLYKTWAYLQPQLLQLQELYRETVQLDKHLANSHRQRQVRGILKTACLLLKKKMVMAGQPGS